MRSASLASQVDQELPIIFDDSCLERFEELDTVGALFKPVGSILQSVTQALPELPRTDFWSTSSQNLLSGIRLDEVIQIGLVRRLVALYSEYH